MQNLRHPMSAHFEGTIYDRSSLLTLKLSIVLSLRGPKGCGNLLVPPIEMYSSIETLCREIAPKGIPFGPTALRASQ